MDNKLFNEFPQVPTELWEKTITEDLKGADYEKKLVWRTNEGIRVKPYYRKEDIAGIDFRNSSPSEFPYVRGNRKSDNAWEIRQDISVSGISEANAKALDALAKGAGSVGFITNGNIKKADHIVSLLKGIDLAKTPVHFIIDGGIPGFYTLLAEAAGAMKADPSKLRGSIDTDPLGRLTISGGYYVSEEADMKLLAENASAASGKSPLYNTIGVNGSIFQNSGSTIVQELGYTLAMGAEYMAVLTGKGLSADAAAGSLQFNLAVGSNYFFEIAKIRAFRLLWAKTAQAFGASEEAAKAYIHSVTSDWDKTLYDPHTNMLRLTTEAMSAVLGGTDSLTVKPFDINHREPNGISDRIARNTQIVLKEEAYFDKIVDPASGSYYIESITDSIAAEAWKVFLKVEKEGGYTAAFKKGTIQADIEATAAKRISDITSRREVILGTNQYPSFRETMIKEIDKNVYGKNQVSAAAQVAKPLKMIRAALAFEELRLKTEKSGKCPKVFMLTIGSLSMRLARSQFSSNFFACAGFEVIDNNGFKSIDDGIAAALNVKADIIVLCSSDEEYATLAPELFTKLNKKAVMVVAGNPPCTDELKAKGIENFISMKSNLLETLQYYQKLLKID